MKWKVAVTAILFAALFALAPLWALNLASDYTPVMDHQTYDGPNLFQPGPTKGEEPAVLPSPTVMPIPAPYAVKPFLLLIIVIMLLLRRVRLTCLCQDIGAIAASAFQCLLDHPHHAPPTDAFACCV